MTTTAALSLPAPHADATVLDNAAWHSLAGPHARFAIGGDLVKRYPADVAPFVAVRTWDDPDVWDALRELVGPGADVGLSGYEGSVPAGWEWVGGGEGVQLVETDALRTRPDDEAIELGADDAAEMIDIVARNQPGPFRPRTYELGRYIGIRRQGRLVAMAGERLHPTGWTEISAVAVDADHRRQGLASRARCGLPHPAARRPRDDARRRHQHRRDRRLRAPRLRPAPPEQIRRGADAGLSNRRLRHPRRGVRRDRGSALERRRRPADAYATARRDFDMQCARSPDVPSLVDGEREGRPSSHRARQRRNPSRDPR